MSNKHHFLKLTPTADTTLDIYADAMEYVFENNDIRNIAISGTYGAGKSSMMETYEKGHSDKKFLHISLAHFEEKEKTEKLFVGEQKEQMKDREVFKTASMETTLEGKILNQLLHQIDPNYISKTDFRIRKDISDYDKREITKLTFGTVLFLLCVCFLCFNAAWCNMVHRFSLPFLRTIFRVTITSEAELVVGIIAVLLSACAVKELLTMQKNRKIFKKLNLQGNEIEIFSDSQDSYFDKYLNEVLYLFEHANVNGTIFEDIDRFDNKLIFEKLREVNFLLNQRIKKKANGRKKEKQEPIRFFYLMRDEIFVSKDRVKFFDFIIPIVPVVNASNAFDMLTRYFEKEGILSLFDNHFLKNISLYIDDMRLLMNIYNEFIIYHDKIDKVPSGLNNNKLLAMILYKNIYPEDFGKIPCKQGYIYTLFANEEIIRQECLKKLQERLEEYEEKRKKMREGIGLMDIDELNAVYFIPDGRISADGRTEKDFKSRKEFVKAVIDSKERKIYNYEDGSWEDYDIIPAISKMEKNEEYIERKKTLSILIGHDFEEEVSKIKSEMERINTAQLKDLINRENSIEIFNRKNFEEKDAFEEMKQDSYFPLIKYLISDGYLDETYAEYMSYFYENIISRSDKEFLRSITDRKAKPYDYVINKPKEVIEEIRMADFSEKEILNIDLLDYLLHNESRYTFQLQRIISRIWDEKLCEFVIQYFCSKKDSSLFIQKLNKDCVGVSKWFLDDKVFSEKIKRRYVIGTLCVSTEEVISKNNIDGIITSYIENQSDFLEIEKEQVQALKNGLKKVNVKFSYIDYTRSNKDMFEFVYKNKMFELNLEMVEEILQYIYGVSNPKDMRERHLSLILSKSNEVLCKYVKENINTYLNRILEKMKKSKDKEKLFISIINKAEIADECKKRFIEIWEGMLSFLSKIHEEKWWSLLLEGGKVAYHPANILEYYFCSGKGLDKTIIDFINGFWGEIILKKEYFVDKYGKNASQEFFDSILQCNALRNDKYKSILCSLGLISQSFPDKNLDTGKMEIQIKLKIIPMDIRWLEIIQTAYKKLWLTYISNNMEEYIKILNKGEGIITKDEMEQVCDASCISENVKITLLALGKIPVSIQNKNYSENLKINILKNNYAEKDLPYFVVEYSNMSELMQNEIYRIAVENIFKIIDLKFKISQLLFQRLIKEDDISVESKQILLAVQCDLGMWKRKVKDALGELQLSRFLDIFREKDIRVENTEANKLLMQAFKKRKWIDDFVIDSTDDNHLIININRRR